MEKEFSFGKMDESIEEPTKMTRKKDKEHSHGQMEENMLENGILENNMVKESILLQKVKLNTENGEKGRE
jgi:hypothetical protein